MMRCLFCDLQTDKKRVLREFKNCFSISDKFPVSEGHMLIISKGHVLDWFSANEIILSDIVITLFEMKNFLKEKYNPQGYNIGSKLWKRSRTNYSAPSCSSYSSLQKY